MNCKEQNGFWNRAFTFIELLVVIAVLFVLTAVLAPAIAKSNGQAGRVTCFNNKRQLAATCAMYTAEWNGWLVPNAPLGVGSTYGWCTDQAQENWGIATGNTNNLPYLNGALGPYAFTRNPQVYKCPNDRIPSNNGERLRSISMNPALMGDMSGNLNVSNSMVTFLHAGPNSWHIFQKDMDVPATMTSQLWVFMDETMYTLNDGYLQCDLDGFSYPDCPANYDNGGNCISFFDGHAEYHKWLYYPGRNFIGINGAPYAYGVARAPNPGITTAGTDQDYRWMQSHTSYK